MTQTKIEEEKIAENNIDDTKIYNAKILVVLHRYKAAYLTEIAEAVVITEYQARLCLSHLVKEGLVENIRVDPNDPDPRLESRVYDQSMKNQAGTANFQRKRWFGLTQKGLKCVKVVG